MEKLIYHRASRNATIYVYRNRFNPERSRNVRKKHTSIQMQPSEPSPVIEVRDHCKPSSSGEHFGKAVTSRESTSAGGRADTFAPLSDVQEHL